VPSSQDLLIEKYSDDAVSEYVRTSDSDPYYYGGPYVRCNCSYCDDYSEFYGEDYDDDYEA
jgi:hypothetical protein